MLLPGPSALCTSTHPAISLLAHMFQERPFTAFLSGTPFHRKEALWKVSPGILQC